MREKAKAREKGEKRMKRRGKATPGRRFGGKVDEVGGVNSCIVSHRGQVEVDMSHILVVSSQ